MTATPRLAPGDARGRPPGSWSNRPLRVKTCRSPGTVGGPWFYGSKAYGIMTSHLGDKAIFMSIDYIDDLDITVLTQ